MIHTVTDSQTLKLSAFRKAGRITSLTFGYLVQPCIQCQRLHSRESNHSLPTATSRNTGHGFIERVASHGPGSNTPEIKELDFIQVCLDSIDVDHTSTVAM